MRKLLPIILLSVAGCASQNNAQIVYKGDTFFGFNGPQLAAVAMSERYAEASVQVLNPAAYAISQNISIDQTPRVSVEDGAVTVSALEPISMTSLSDISPITVEKRSSTASIQQQSFLPKNFPTRYVKSIERTADAGIIASPNGEISLRAQDTAYTEGLSAVTKRVELMPTITARASSFIWPAEGKLISQFGAKENGKHNDGINIAAQKGSTFRASMDGIVVYAGNELESYGNMVILRHENGWMSAYAHADSLKVDVDQRVSQGQPLGIVGMTGNVTSAQLHFGLRDGKQAVDPTQFLENTYAAAH